jgi:hypothetical protein
MPPPSAVDRGDHRYRERLDLVEAAAEPERVAPALLQAHRAPLLDVAAHGERAVAGAGDDDRADARLRAEVAQRLFEVLGKPAPHRVHRARPVECERGDRAPDREEDLGVAHPGITPFQRRTGRRGLAA